MQVETETNMKSQVSGVRKTSEEAESPQKKNKRIKLSHKSENGSSEKVFVESFNVSENGIQSDVTLEIPCGSEILEPNLNGNSCEIDNPYTNGSLNNGDRSSYEENGNKGSLNEIPNITEEGSCFEGEETLNQTESDMQAFVESGTHDSPQLAPPTLEQYSSYSNPASFTSLEVPENIPEDIFSKAPEEVPISPTEESSHNGQDDTPEMVLPCSSIQSELQTESTPLKISVLNTDGNIPVASLVPSNEAMSSASNIVAESHVDMSLEEPEVNSKAEDISDLAIYDLKTTLLEGHADVIYSVAANDNIVLSSSGDTTVKVWDVAEQAELSNFAGHTDSVTSIVLLNPDQSKLLAEKLGCHEISSIAISASLDCNIKAWSVDNGKELISIYTFNSVTCMGYLQPDLCVIGTEGGKLEVWSLTEKRKIDCAMAHESAVSDLKVHDDHIYCTSVDGAVKVWVYEEEELMPLYSRRRRETSSVGSDLGPTLWKSIAVHNDMIFLGDKTPYLKVLNWRLGRMRLLKNQKTRAGECDALLVKDNILLSTAYDSSSNAAGINVWLLPDLTYIGSLCGELQDVFCLTLTRLENKLRIVSGGHQLIVWDFNLKEPSKPSPDAEFSFQEVEGLGVEVQDKNERVIKIERSTSSTSLKKNTTEKESRCNII